MTVLNICSEQYHNIIMNTLIKRANELIERFLKENDIEPDQMGTDERNELANTCMVIARNEYKLGFIK